MKAAWGFPRIAARAAALAAVVLMLTPLASFAQETHTFTVSVTDKQGHTVEGLTATNFKAEYHGRPARVRTAVLQGGNRTILVLVDISPSISDPDWLWDLAWATVGDLLHYFPAPHRFQIATFDQTLRFHGVIAAGSSRERIATALDAIRKTVRNLSKPSPRGNSPIFDTLLVLEQLRVFREDPPDVICLISDMVDAGSRVSSDETERVLASRDLPVFVFLLPAPPIQHLPAILSGPNRAKQLTDAIGGMVFDIPVGGKKRDPFERFHPFYDSMIHRYYLEVEFPQAVDKIDKWKLEVVDDRGHKLKGVELSYPQLVAPLPAQP